MFEFVGKYDPNINRLRSWVGENCIIQMLFELNKHAQACQRNKTNTLNNS